MAAPRPCGRIRARPAAAASRLARVACVLLWAAHAWASAAPAGLYAVAAAAPDAYGSGAPQDALQHSRRHVLQTTSRPPSPRPPRPPPRPPSPPRPPAVYMELLDLTAPVVALLLAQVPRTRRYLFIERAYNPDERLRVGLTGGTLDLDTGEKISFNTGRDYMCSGPLVLGDGAIYAFGGDAASPPHNLLDGRNAIGRFNPGPTSMTRVSVMQKNRWYPSPLRLYDGKVLIVGGSNVCGAGPKWNFAEVWDPAVPTAPTASVPLPPSFEAAMGLNWYPTMLLMRNGDVLWFADTRGAITDQNFNVKRNLPILPASITYRTMYPRTSAVIELAAKPPDYCTRFVLFGGQRTGANRTAPAATTSLRLELCPCTRHPSGWCYGRGWEVEDMLGIPRLMGHATHLPTSRVLLYGGAQAGVAGISGSSSRANGIHLMYDADAPSGRRYRALPFSPIPRVYHTANCLDKNGKVFVAGCENCGSYIRTSGMSRSPNGSLEFRLEFAVPAEIGPGKLRPDITSFPPNIVPGTTFDVGYTYGGGAITGASLVSPCSATHSLNFNLPVIALEIERLVSPGVVRLKAPPMGLFGQALYGDYLLFLVGQDYSYSEGEWVQVVRP